MAQRRTLLHLSLGDSALLVFGPEPEIGEHPTTLWVRRAPNGLKLWVTGIDVEVAGGEVVLPAPLLVEHAQYDIYLHGPSPRLLDTVPRAETVKLRYRTESMSHYALNYGSAVGDVAWLWRTPEGEVAVDLEVFPTKLDYREDFAAIKEDIRRLARLLLADIAGVTGAGFAPLQEPQEAQIEWLEQVRRESLALREAMTALLPRLREQVHHVEIVAPADRLRGKRPARRRDNALLALGLAPAMVAVRSAELTEATALNGHLRWEVDRFLSIGQQVLSSDWFLAADNRFREALRAALDAAWEWRKRLASAPPVRELPHLQTRLRDPLYARAFASLRRLRLGLHEGQSPELLGLKNLWLLYEYWVFLQLVELLKSRFPTVTAASPSLVREIGGQLYLVKGNESRIVLGDPVGREVACFYNRAFTNLPTTGQRPDITIELLESHELLLVDAKYRLGRTPRYLERYGMPGPEEEDINVLHRYRDAIIELEDPERKPVVGGLIAFPGPELEGYRDHHFFRSWETARIGGVPMLPGRIALMDEVVGEQLSGEASDY